MFKQLIVLLFVAGVVVCQDAGEQTATTTSAPATDAGLGESLLDLAIIGSKNVKRTFDDSRPTLNSIGSSLWSKFDELRNNPTIKKGVESVANNASVKRGLEATKQQVGSLYNQISSNPTVQAASAQGKSRLSKIIAQVDERSRKLIADHEARQQALKGGHQ